MKPPALSIEQITTSLECLYVQTIPESYRDENNHMNIRWYLAVFDEAAYPLFEQFGLSPATMHTVGAGTFDLEHHIHYLNEVGIGDTVAVYHRVVGRSAKRVHYLSFMVNETRGRIAAIWEVVNSYIDLSARKTAPYPPEVAAKIDAILAQHTALDWDAPICGVMSA